MDKLLDLRHLRYFVTVAEELHFGRAAQKLHISQPPLSQQIKALETELDVQLLDRSARKVELTVAGAAFLEEARATLARAERAATVARQAAKGEVGRIDVGFTSSLPFVPIFGQSLDSFRKAYPQVRIELFEMITRRQISAMVEGQIDVGFLRSPLPEMPATIKTRRVHLDGLVLLAQSQHRLAKFESITIADLQDEPLILMNPKAHAGLNIQLFTLFAEAGFSPRIAQYATNPWTPIGLAAAGMGVAIVNSTLVRQLSIDGLEKVPVRGKSLTNEVHFAYFERPSPAVREFTRIVINLAKENTIGASIGEQ